MTRARFALVIVALLAGIGWRAELEWHGWYSVEWVGWFHWAIPLGAALFAGWLVAFAGARQRMLLAALSLALAAVSYVVLHDALLLIYSRWPQPELDYMLANAAALAVFVGHPVGTWLAGRLCGARVRLVPCLLALGLWTGAAPLAIALLGALDHVGGADFLHAIKSGFVIPPLLLALGLPFVWRGPLAPAITDPVQGEPPA